MKRIIASWNVNSVRARMPILLNWLEDKQPDIVLLQETKVEDHIFPRAEIEDLGYNLATWGQKSYNGVAILAKQPIEDVRCGLPGEEEDTHARYIEAVVGDVRVASVYVPNGSEVDSISFHYKLRFLERLCRHLQTLLEYEEAFLIGGDYNIAPEAIDVYNPQKAEGDVMFTLEERRMWRKLLNLGLFDALRVQHPSQPDLYSWWDYRAGSWEQNRGWRIDHFLLSPQAIDRLHASGVDSGPRGLERASDHAPVWVEIN